MKLVIAGIMNGNHPSIIQMTKIYRSQKADKFIALRTRMALFREVRLWLKMIIM